MKLRNVFAAVTAAVVAAATVVTAGATTYFGGTNADKSGMLACILSDDPNVPLFTDYASISDLVGFTVTIKATDKRAVEGAIAEGSWIGGAFIFNSQSTGWKQYSWAVEGTGTADGYFVPGAKRGEYVLTYTQDTPIFASTDTYAQICLHNYADAYEFDVVSYTLLNSKGEDITKAAAETTAPAETTAAPEETKAPEETTAPAEETVEVSIDTAEVETFEVETAEVETAEVDTAEVAITEAATAEAATAEAATAEAPADNAADANKGNPETGVAGVTVAAGVVALAGAAVVASRKRK